ncbi:MAG: YggT family protein [Deltaproteobacteria bacterium]|uniref:YggT family protein n=1 Tax=Candidatus Zymogenus saltonus TaxID=2844893 RepID=A0A9D8KHU4_9DELT|nr:YggT family protein [Candidatus Zymogenus saltonus]
MFTLITLNDYIRLTAHIINIVIIVYIWIIIIRALISWVNPNPFNPVVKFLRDITDPVLVPARRLFPAGGMIDLSPIIVILILLFLKIMIVQTLLYISGTTQGVEGLVILGIFVYAVAMMLNMIINVIIFIVVVRAILSWISPDPRNPIVFSIYVLSEPFLRPVKRIIPSVGTIDLSPLVVILIMVLLKIVLINPLFALYKYLAFHPVLIF